MKANAGNPERDRKNDCLAESRMTGGRSKLFDLRDTCRQTGQENGKSPKDGADRNEKKQRATTGTERIPRVETQAAGCFGTYRRIQFEERESRGVAKHALYRETPRSGRRTNDYFLLSAAVTSRLVSRTRGFLREAPPDAETAVSLEIYRDRERENGKRKRRSGALIRVGFSYATTS